MPTPKFTPEIVAAAIEGFEEHKRRIDSQVADLRSMLAGSSKESAKAAPEPTKATRRKMSVSSRKRMGAAQRKRWAASKAQSGSVVQQKLPKAKGKLSEAGRKAIIAATKKRWALKRAQAAKSA